MTKTTLIDPLSKRNCFVFNFIINNIDKDSQDRVVTVKFPNNNNMNEN